MSVEAFFLPVSETQRFCIFHPAHSAQPYGLILYIHPFAEEMNQSRRMAALQCRAFARAGYAVLQIDLLGCGDSSGDFGDATWQAWIDDVVQACKWLRQWAFMNGATPDNAPLWLWGLRAGSLLCCQAALHISEPCHFLFWQPPVHGKLLLHQFLRLKLAGDMLNRRTSNAMDAIRKTLNAGGSVEIAGYTLAADLAHGLEHATLTPPECGGEIRRMRWLELSVLDPPQLHVPSNDTVLAWQRAGYQVERQVITGSAFWQLNTTNELAELLDITTAWFTVGSTA